MPQSDRQIPCPSKAGLSWLRPQRGPRQRGSCDRRCRSLPLVELFPPPADSGPRRRRRLRDQWCSRLRREPVNRFSGDRMPGAFTTSSDQSSLGSWERKRYARPDHRPKGIDRGEATLLFGCNPGSSLAPFFRGFLGQPNHRRRDPLMMGRYSCHVNPLFDVSRLYFR